MEDRRRDSTGILEDRRRDSTGISATTQSTMDASSPEQPVSRRRGLKRKSTSINNSGGSNSQSKRQTREKSQAASFSPIYMNGPCTRARVQPYNSYSSSEVVRVKSEMEVREAAEKAEEMSRLIVDWEALEAKIEAEYEAIRSRDASVHVVPIHAGWFSWTEVHPLEERMLPSFFNGKSDNRSPELYMEIRNCIMKKFHFNPNEQIELEYLSELMVGDLDARREVMEFLDYWGLINYHPFPHQENSAMIVDSNATKDESLKMETLVETLFKFEAVQSWTPTIPRMSTATPATSSGLIPEPAIADELVKSEGPSVEYHCNSCAADCSRKRYHCQKQADFDLCAECYNNGMFGSYMSPSDFILMEPPEAGGASGGKWTDQETLLLLEAIELFRDNWSEIAEHVATKTKTQCILHFAQMPIEDAFFSHDEHSDAPKENGVPDSNIEKNSDPKIEQDSDTAPKDVTAKIDSQDVTKENQESSCLVEIPKTDEVKEYETGLPGGESFALKALKEAFEAVGYFPSPGEGLSFAESGNPVMTLAAFLVRLVKPNIVNASIHSLLKSLSSSYANEELAARYCFRLEDPLDDKKDPTDAYGATTETTQHESEKAEDGQAEKQEEVSVSVDGVSSGNDQNDGNKDSASEEHYGTKEIASKSRKQGTSGIKDQTVSEAPKGTEESVVSASRTETQMNKLKGSEETTGEGSSNSKEPTKDEDIIATSENKGADALVVSEKENSADDREAKDLDNKKQESPVTKDDIDINDKLKRAAVTALSAAAVKAKLLADQEEEQILQLSTFLIEKQLYKLETKLAFFTDMESVAMRVKEQLERSKQRLFQERAQIIATRFGMSGPPRPTSQVLPPNKPAVGFPNVASRPFMGTNALRPPISRPMVQLNSTSSTSLTGRSPQGSSVQSNADKPSSNDVK